MQTPLGKVAHVAAAAVLVAYCLWAESSTSSRVRDAAKLDSEWLEALLSPQIEPQLPRDPFAPMKATPVPTATELAVAAASAEALDATAEAPPLELSATCIHGDRRLALINGSLYAQGESLEGAEDGPRYTIALIETDKVVLDRGGELLLIEYTNRSRPTSEKPGRTSAPAGGAPSKSK